MSVVNYGVITKTGVEPGRAKDILAGMTSFSGLSLSNDSRGGKAVIQLVGIPLNFESDILEELSASDERLWGHWELSPGEYLFLNGQGYDWPWGYLDMGGLTVWWLLTFGPRGTIGWCARGETA